MVKYCNTHFSDPISLAFINTYGEPPPDIFTKPDAGLFKHPDPDRLTSAATSETTNGPMNINFNLTISIDEKQFNQLLNLITESKEQIMATQAELEQALNETKTEVQGLRSQLVAIDQRLEAVLANPPVDLAAAMQLVADIRAEIAGAGSDAAKIETVEGA